MQIMGKTVLVQSQEHVPIEGDTREMPDSYKPPLPGFGISMGHVLDSGTNVFSVTKGQMILYKDTDKSEIVAYRNPKTKSLRFLIQESDILAILDFQDQELFFGQD